MVDVTYDHSEGVATKKVPGAVPEGWTVEMVVGAVICPVPV